MKAILIGYSLLSLPFLPVHAAEDNSVPPINRLILDAVKAMPPLGGYATTSTANRALTGAVSTSGGRLSVRTSGAIPSYCSGATYLVFLRVLSDLQSSGRLSIAPYTLTALRPAGQPDGSGIWGRWNANGPGTARLFHELGLGPSFTSLAEARAGDFLKIFWNDGIGASEHGHSVIYLGNDPSADTLTFWSSNIPGGYGQRTVPMRRVHRLLFSRLEHPEAINHPLPAVDPYLRSLQNRSSSAEEMASQCGILR